MSTSRRLAAAAAIVVLWGGLAACGPSHNGQNKGADQAAPPAAAHQIPAGAGPQDSYHAAAQPAAGSCHYRYSADKQPLPDLTCTPGATSPAVTQATLNQTICKQGGYTSGIRPPASVTGKEKSDNAKSYGYTGPMADAEYDHLISLQLGGDPNDPRNLWVEPPSPGHVSGKGPNNPKDSVETHLHTAICKGQTTLAAAQQAIATDWTTAEAKLGLSGGAPATADPDDDAN
ncbi:hypothetical protein C7C46_04705 [Streptomyces tateyamensis]|uniref:HNH endonuclease n=1 Tax=Streptomyces tateyamensis TaxID=565073 RepID=A0A2V4P950_9ACTN|nr:hypothetical protein [Streptomyces tateyamensis]PYC87384.1 hypothetical protein C7C46_04705 [Streptomyces tateyamensis]